MLCFYKQIGFFNNFQPFSVCPVTPLHNFSTPQSVFVPRYNGSLSPLVYTMEMVELYAVLTEDQTQVFCIGGRFFSTESSQKLHLPTVCLLSLVPFFETPWTGARQCPSALLSIGFLRQEYQNGLPFPSPWIYLKKIY